MKGIKLYQRNFLLHKIHEIIAWRVRNQENKDNYKNREKHRDKMQPSIIFFLDRQKNQGKCTDFNSNL